MWLLIDDLRELQADVVARTYNDGLNQLKSTQFEGLMIDHDLGEAEDRLNGYTLINESLSLGVCPHIVVIVSANPVGRENIGRALLNAGYETKNRTTYTKR